MSGLHCPICGKDDGTQMYGVVICKAALAKANAENEHLQSALRERDEARAEVERLKQERNALQIRAQEAEGAVWKARLRGDGVQAAHNDACAQCEADWNACCDVLGWARRFGKDLPPPSRAVAAALEELAKVRGATP